MADTMHPFQCAVEARDTAAIESSLADDVVFSSPNTFRPHRGKPITAAFLRAVLRVLEDFRYVREINDPETNSHALVFEATVSGKTVNGCDFIHVNDEGLIDDFMVMIRPLSGAMALSEAMGAQFPQIQAEAAEEIAALAAKEQ